MAPAEARGVSGTVAGGAAGATALATWPAEPGVHRGAVQESLARLATESGAAVIVHTGGLRLLLASGLLSTLGLTSAAWAVKCWFRGEAFQNEASHLVASFIKISLPLTDPVWEFPHRPQIAGLS